MTKRFRLMEGDQQIDMAGVLMLLSRDKASNNSSSYTPNHNNRIFECKTCSRKFQSFQALGGHRASHKKPKVNEDSKNEGGENKQKVHECSICGLEFAIGQALGGHMRRHRGDHTLNRNHSHNNNNSINHEESSRGEDQKKKLWLDLNLPPGNDEDMECFREYGINEIVENIHMVDCLH